VLTAHFDKEPQILTAEQYKKRQENIEKAKEPQKKKAELMKVRGEKAKQDSSKIDIKMKSD